MSLVFYQAKFSSATPVATALAELDVPHETVTFDLSKADHKKPEFLRLNPNGKVPTLIVDGTPLFEALAILQWLGDRYGVQRGLWPAFDAPERLRAVSWTTWAYCSYAPALMRYAMASSERVPEAARNSSQAALAKEEVERLQKVLESQLGQQPFVLGNDYSLADLVLANMMQYSTVCGLPPEGQKKTQAWLAGCMQRPAIAKEWAPPASN